jgi:uncharacterized damage-inducible protein DinB
MATSSQIHTALLHEVDHRLFEESLTRILTCLDKLTNEQIWWRPNESSNSIGNLVLHLCGNVRQWIGSGLGDLEDHRKRQTEFDERRVISKENLVSELLTTMMMAREIISTLPENELLKLRPVQTFEETGLTILIHVTEHFSYHTGQIAYITKLLSDSALAFYEGIALE